MEIEIFGTRFCFIKYFIHSLYKDLNYKPLSRCSTNFKKMKNKHFYNPEISNPGDFDWENDRVSYSLSQFEKLQFSTLAKVENELFKNLGKIISKSTGSQYVFDGVRDNNIQQLINLLYKVRDFIDKKVTLN